MGTGRHGNVAWHLSYRRRGRTQCCNDRRPGEGSCSLQSEPHCLSELYEQERRHRHDQGRRDGGTRKRRNRRDRAQIHQSAPALLESLSQALLLGSASSLLRSTFCVSPRSITQSPILQFLMIPCATSRALIHVGEFV